MNKGHKTHLTYSLVEQFVHSVCVMMRLLIVEISEHLLGSGSSNICTVDVGLVCDDSVCTHNNHISLCESAIRPKVVYRFERIFMTTSLVMTSKQKSVLNYINEFLTVIQDELAAHHLLTRSIFLSYAIITVHSIVIYSSNFTTKKPRKTPP